jgi:hypothetical protein
LPESGEGLISDSGSSPFLVLEFTAASPDARLAPCPRLTELHWTGSTAALNST